MSNTVSSFGTLVRTCICCFEAIWNDFVRQNCLSRPFKGIFHPAHVRGFLSKFTILKIEFLGPSKYTVCKHVCERTFQPGNCTDWGSERANPANSKLTGLRHPSFNHCRIQLRHRVQKTQLTSSFFVGAQTVISLLQTTQIISDVCFITDHVARLLPQPNLSEGADRVGAGTAARR